MTGNYPKLDLVNVGVHAKFGQILKIISENKILKSIKSHYSVKMLQKILGNNPKLGLFSVNVHTKFGQILFIRSQERKRNSDVNQGQ